MVDLARLRAAYEKVRDELLAERTPDGHWVGELSSSALSTATAVSALAIVKATTDGRGLQGENSDSLDPWISRGTEWLIQQQNPDGGFGDTDLSHSNIATTYLVVAALHLAGVADKHAELIQRANAYVESRHGLRGLRDRYGIDKTFVVPIMTNLALAGLVEWRDIDPLPFELACVPQSWYRFVGMPVVSYAIPALVAIGQARFFHAPPRNPITRFVRRLSINRSLKVLRRMQPDSGGYLEATPLTSFVVMSLASLSAIQNPKSKIQNRDAEQVIHSGVSFLVNAARPDGSWPIDTNLATWNTTISINALAGAGEDISQIGEINEQKIRDVTTWYMTGRSKPLQKGQHDVLHWLVSCQHLKRHPFTGANPGGFGWSDLSGAVPDADDTPGAVLAFGAIVSLDMRVPISRNLIGNLLFRAFGWLQGMQNRDGGWPTFCRGWGKLPFDRSGTDLTAHALRAFVISSKRYADSGDDHSAQHLRRLLDRKLPAALSYLRSQQHPDGSWSPLWFGNQDHPSEENPVYGTAKVLMAYRDLGLMDSPEAQRGITWLINNQNADGGWGSGVWQKRQISDLQFAINNLQSSIEETSLALEALLAACPNLSVPCPLSPVPSAALRGLSWLLDRVESGQHRQPAPIGFYFAKLWYYERLYPLIFTVAALGRAYRQFSRQPAHPNASPAPGQTASADAT